MKRKTRTTKPSKETTPVQPPDDEMLEERLYGYDSELSHFCSRWTEQICDDFQLQDLAAGDVKDCYCQVTALGPGFPAVVYFKYAICARLIRNVQPQPPLPETLVGRRTVTPSGHRIIINHAALDDDYEKVTRLAMDDQVTHWVDTIREVTLICSILPPKPIIPVA